MKETNDTKRHLPVQNRPGNADTIDLLDLFFYLRSKILYLLGALIIGIVIAGGYTKLKITPTYRASAYLYMVASSSGSVIDLSDFNIGDKMTDDYMGLLTRRPVLENVVSEMNGKILVLDDLPDDVEVTDEDYKTKLVLNTITDLTNYITISSVGSSRLLMVSVTTPFKSISRDTANAIVEQAVDYIPQIMNASAPTIAEYAVTPKDKFSPSTVKNAMTGGMLGLLLVGGFFVVLYLLDDTIKTAEDFEKYFGIVPLSSLPEADLGEREKDTQDEKKGRFAKLGKRGKR